MEGTPRSLSSLRRQGSSILRKALCRTGIAPRTRRRLLDPGLRLCRNRDGTWGLHRGMPPPGVAPGKGQRPATRGPLATPVGAKAPSGRRGGGTSMLRPRAMRRGLGPGSPLRCVRGDDRGRSHRLGVSSRRSHPSRPSPRARAKGPRPGAHWQPRPKRKAPSGRGRAPVLVRPHSPWRARPLASAVK